jgi:hypothetical protein
VLELDPSGDGSIVWSYRGSETNPFFSDTRGLAQRLLNGNTLITESQRGHAFEVDHEGDIVWDYWSPYVLQGGRFRVPIRLIRLQGKPAEFVAEKLGKDPTATAG